MKKKTIAGLIAIVAIVSIVMFSGCVEEDYDGVIYEDKIFEELSKADTVLIIAHDAIDKGDYDVAIQKAYDARSFVDTAYRHYLEGEELFTDGEKVNYKTVFEIYGCEYELVIGTSKWMRTIEELDQETEEIVDDEDAMRILPKMEVFARSSRELAKDWRGYADKIDFVIKTNPDVNEYLNFITDDISDAKEMASILDETAQELDSDVLEIRTEIATEYVPFPERDIPEIVEIPAVSSEIIPSDLARFFDGFDIDGSGDIDLGEAEDFYYWVEDNIVYRYDDENEQNPDPGYPVGDGRPGPEYWQTPYETRTEGAGDCEDMAILETALYNYFGISAYVAGVNAQDPEYSDHAICIVAIGGTSEEFAYLLGELEYYELEGWYTVVDGCYMIVDNAYSDTFGTLPDNVGSEYFIIVEDEIYTLEETIERSYSQRMS
ncbi:hypothetical protein KAW18_15025 [candidate division WOR-3 bacterium]|nr:hypothetical protein [candidate division WOR-3 bacterium]